MSVSVFRDHPLDLGGYEDLYKHFHSHPELSLHEKNTSATIAGHKALGAYKVHSGIGGHGVVGVLSNGDGPTILLRADMDALPVKEKTGLDYASKVTDKDGGPVMHACGHDMHVTCLLGAAAWLADAKDKWSGTLIVLFQPNEERGKGARAMVDDGLYGKIPKPDVVLAQHVQPGRAGKVAVKAGTMIASADSFKITVHGRGGHGSMPQLCIDPVLIAASIVVRLQGIVAREVDPQDTAVVTVGSIHAGSSDNIIPDSAELLLDMRTQKEETRQRILKAIKRIVEKVSLVSCNTRDPRDAERSSGPRGLSSLAFIPCTLGEVHLVPYTADNPGMRGQQLRKGADVRAHAAVPADRQRPEGHAKGVGRLCQPLWRRVQPGTADLQRVRGHVRPRDCHRQAVLLLVHRRHRPGPVGQGGEGGSDRGGHSRQSQPAVPPGDPADAADGCRDDVRGGHGLSGASVNMTRL